jgi:hypothetical protein
MAGELAERTLTQARQALAVCRATRSTRLDIVGLPGSYW